jgi:hypothetical protein
VLRLSILILDISSEFVRQHSRRNGQLVTRGKTWTSIGDELWRFVLYSEFVFDLPEQLPDALGDVPCAALEARPLIEDLCDRLRNDRRTQPTYIERAEVVETELNLVALCQHITDLGARDTFPFEERSFFRQAVEAVQRDDVDKVRLVLGRHTRSVWIGKGESQTQWVLLHAAVRLIEACDDGQRKLSDHARTQETLLDFYLASLREVDRLQREFEQAAGDYIDYHGDLQDVVTRARSDYRRLVENVQNLFIKHLETSGWPPAGMRANADVFDRVVAPKLQESGRRVAFVLVDALRYELGVALEKEPQEQHFTIRYGETGHSFETIVGPYLAGAKEVIVEDPYVRITHQVQNLVRFCEAVVKLSAVRKIRLITSYDNQEQLTDVQQKFEELKQSLLESDVERVAHALPVGSR